GSIDSSVKNVKVSSIQNPIQANLIKRKHEGKYDMTKTLTLTQEQSHWFAEQVIEWAAAKIASLLVIEVGVEHTIDTVVSRGNIETAIEVIQERLADSSLDRALITILGVLGIKAFAEQISQNNQNFDVETSKRVCDAYAAEHS